jgi:hypothetical protein
MLFLKKNRFLISMQTEKKETVLIIIDFDFPTLALSRSGYKGVISAQSKLKNMDRSTPTTYSKELIMLLKRTTINILYGRYVVKQITESSTRT